MLGRRPAAHEPGEIIIYAFDLLYLDGRDLRELPQRERRRLLKPLLEGRIGAIRLSEEVEADGETFFRVACELGLEGIIAKHRARPDRSGKRPEWLKIKCIRRDNFVMIVGFEPSTVPGAIGRLLLAAMKGGSPVYVGGVGTGFTRQSSAKLRELLEQIPIKTPAASAGRMPFSPGRYSPPRSSIAPGLTIESCAIRPSSACMRSTTSRRPFGSTGRTAPHK